MCTFLVSADLRVTAPQLNLSECSEKTTGNLIVAGDDITLVSELLDPLCGQVSLRVMVPLNWRVNTSKSTSGEGVVVALTELSTVHILPMMCDVRPKNCVSFDKTASLEMM